MGAAPLDRRAAAVAARQFGVITYAQLRACGLSLDRVLQRVEAGHLQRLFRGVYAFGHQELTREGRLLAGVLACGPGAVLSHRSAAERWGILGASPDRIDITVTTRGGRERRRPIRLHCVRRLDEQDVTEVMGLPATTPARTLVDLCTTEPDRTVERALDQARVLKLLKHGELESAIERARGRRTMAIRRLLDAERRTSTLTRSELEERFLKLVRAAGLPDPEVNARLHGFEVDFLWRDRRRVVEVDGYAFHSVPGAFERDRRKDIDLELAGYGVTRFTYRQVVYEPKGTGVRLRKLLGAQ